MIINRKVCVTPISESAISGSYASIFVTGISSTDVVTIEKDGLSIGNGKWVDGEENGVLFSRISKYGIYVITANNGTATETIELKVNAADAFVVNIEYTEENA